MLVNSVSTLATANCADFSGDNLSTANPFHCSFCTTNVFTVHSAWTVFSLFILHHQCFQCSFCMNSVFTVNSTPPVFSVFILNKVFSVHSAWTVFSQFILHHQCFHSLFCTNSVFTFHSAPPVFSQSSLCLTRACLLHCVFAVHSVC